MKTIQLFFCFVEYCLNLFIYVNIVIPYVKKSWLVLGIIDGGIAVITASFISLSCSLFLMHEGDHSKMINDVL